MVRGAGRRAARHRRRGGSLAGGLVPPRGTRHRGGGRGDDRLHRRHPGPGAGSGAPPVLGGDLSAAGGAGGAARPAAASRPASRAPDLEVVLRRFRSAIEIFREANLPLFSELEELSASYQRLTGGITVEWEGETRTLPQLGPFLKSPDRACGSAPSGRWAAPYVAMRGQTRRPLRRDVRAAASGWRRTRGSPTSRPTASPPSAASTTPRTTSPASTRRWRRRSSRR